MRTSTGSLQDPVVGSPQDKIMLRSRDVHWISTKQVFNSQTTLKDIGLTLTRLVKT